MTSLPVPIPSGYTLSVKLDQKVSAGDVLATKESSSSEIAIEISQSLGLSGKDGLKTLLKNPGDRVEEGDVLARKGGMMGSREIRSKVSGTAIKYEEESGRLFIRTADEVSESGVSEIISPVDGTISVCDNDKVVLKTDREAILAEEGSGDTGVGEIYYVEGKEIDAFKIDSKVNSKILLGEKLSRDAIAKAIGLYASGVISQEIEDLDFQNLREKMIKTPVLRVSEENFAKIVKKSGKFMIDGNKKLIIKL